MNKIQLIVLLIFLAASLSGQVLTDNPLQAQYNADSVRSELEKAPYFTLFKDNYFLVGGPLNEKLGRNNVDAKFQLSVLQRLTKSRLPFNTYLFLQYTQKVFWNVLEESLPIREMNFNPGFGLGHLIVYKNKYIGKGYLMLEHESNGKDSLESRSWNRLSLGIALDINCNLQVQLKTWIPNIDGRRNKDLLTYTGVATFGANLRTNNKRFNFGLALTPHKSIGDFNTQVELSYRFNGDDNQFLFMQYYNGYAENLLEYKQYKSVLRIGFVFKPNDFSLY